MMKMEALSPNHYTISYNSASHNHAFRKAGSRGKTMMEAAMPNVDNPISSKCVQQIQLN